MAEGISIQGCSRCGKPAILHQEYSGQHFCAYHLGQSIRKRVSKDLRNQLVLPKDARHEDGRPFTILACISGGKDSAVLLDMLVDIISKRRDVHIVAGHSNWLACAVWLKVGWAASWEMRRPA